MWKAVGRSLAAMLSLIFLLCGCDHKDLCYNHPEHAVRYQTLVRASYDLRWELREPEGKDWASDWPSGYGMEYVSLNPPMPDGLCVNAYADGAIKAERHLPPEGGVVEMVPGLNTLLMYNDDTEFIIFNDLNNSASAKATTRTRTRAGYTGNPLNTSPSGDMEKTVTPPDMLFGYYNDAYEQLPAVNPQELAVTLKPLVFKYLVRYEFKSGAQYVGVARGAMTGMAESVFLSDGHTGDDRATVLYDCDVREWGVEAVVNTFGVPNYPNPNYTRAGEFYGLNLEVMLKNGKTLQFNFDVSAQVAAQPHGGVIVVSGIEIDDNTGSQGGSGFDVKVDGWGDYEDVIIDL